MNKLKKISIIMLSTLAIATSTFAATVVSEDGVRIRTEASTSSTIKTNLGNGTKVEIIEKVGDWYKIKYNDTEGFIYGELIELEENEKNIQTVTTVGENENEVTPEETQKPVAEEKIYPKNVTTISNTIVYILPVISSSSITTIEAGKTITINKVLNGWSYIKHENYIGWVRNYVLNYTAPIASVEKEEQKPENTEEQPQEPVIVEPQETIPSIKKGYISVTAANVREKPSTDEAIITTLDLNVEVEVIAETEEWYKIKYNNIEGYVAKRLISDKLTEVTSRSTEDARQGTIQETNVTPVQTSASEPKTVATVNSSAGEAIVACAKKYLGYSYVYGGTTPSGGFDCTGFTYYIYNACGYKLSRSCSVQVKSGVSVSRTNLQPGDLLAFNNTSDGSIGHVGIYIGNGKFIHAANSRRGVVTDTIESGYYNTYYYLARRIV